MSHQTMIDAGIDAIKAEPMDELAIERSKAGVLRLLDEIGRQNISSPPLVLNRRRWVRGACGAVAAAGIAFVVVGPFNLYAPKSLYAQAIGKLSRGDFAYSLSRIGENGEVLSVTRYWVAKDGRRRTESGSSVSIDDQFGNPKLVYSTNDLDKRATVFKPTTRTNPVTFENSWFGPLANADNATNIGTETVDGHTLERFRVEPGEPNLVFDVWIDAQAKAVSRVEYVETRHPMLVGKHIVSDLLVDQNFDESLFSTIPPKGYQVIEWDLPSQQ